MASAESSSLIDAGDLARSVVKKARDEGIWDGIGPVPVRKLFSVASGIAPENVRFVQSSVEPGRIISHVGAGSDRLTVVLNENDPDSDDRESTARLLFHVASSHVTPALIRFSSEEMKSREDDFAGNILFPDESVSLFVRRNGVSVAPVLINEAAEEFGIGPDLVLKRMHQSKIPVQLGFTHLSEQLPFKIT